MSKDLRQKKFDAYGKLSSEQASFTEQNGRYPAQAEYEKCILSDVLGKLALKPDSNLLDIGCGMGNILIPASFLVDRVTGIDHPKVIDRLSDSFKRDNCSLMGEDFLEADIKGPFNRILAYGVLPALPDQDTVMKFIDKILSLLPPDGLALIGDFPNSDKRQRFITSKRGAEFTKMWNQRVKDMPAKSDTSEANSLPTAHFDDEIIMNICGYIRSKGLHAYVVTQNQNLPFGNTREDILIVGPEYDDGTGANI